MDRLKIYFGDKADGVFWKLAIGWWWNMWHVDVSDFRKWMCGDLFSEMGNKYEEIVLGKENQECGSINSNFDEINYETPK